MDYRFITSIAIIFYAITGINVSRALEQIITANGKPEQIRCDNGPEFLSNALTEYCSLKKITLKHSNWKTDKERLY
jgi:putative transposase